MRNESMKKFGTPIGAGPGSDRENVGLELLGTPFPVGSLVARVGRLRLAFGCRVALEDVVCVWPWVEDFWGDDDVGWGVVPVEVVVVVVLVGGLAGGLECEGEVEVELEVELDDDELDELDELDGAYVVEVVVVAVEDELEAGAQVIVSETVPGMPRSGMTPGVAATGTVFRTPPMSVTVMVHESAEAVGTTAVASPTNVAAASTSAARSLRLILKLVRPRLRPSWGGLS